MLINGSITASLKTAIHYESPKHMDFAPQTIVLNVLKNMIKNGMTNIVNINVVNRTDATKIVHQTHMGFVQRNTV